MKFIIKSIIACSFVFSFSIFTGCASVVSGQQQTVTVSTDPIKDASCTLENNKGSWEIPSTPGRVSVRRSMDDLYVECKKKGFPKAHKTISSSTKALAFGNALLGPGGVLIGGAIDTSTGAAFDYPQEIKVPIKVVA